MRPDQQPKAAPGRHRKLGSAISLNAFAKAKKSGYDPREVKEKERALAARTVNKYKKLQRRLNADQAPPPPSQVADGEAPGPNGQAPSASAPPPRHAGPAGGAHDGASARPRPADDMPRHRMQHSKFGGRSHGKPELTSLQRLAQEAQTKKDEEKRQREERQQQAAARQARLQQDSKKRREQSKLFRKKTQHGQPVIKHRIEKILQQLAG